MDCPQRTQLDYEYQHTQWSCIGAVGDCPHRNQPGQPAMHSTYTTTCNAQHLHHDQPAMHSTYTTTCNAQHLHHDQPAMHSTYTTTNLQCTAPTPRPAMHSTYTTTLNMSTPSGVAEDSTASSELVAHSAHSLAKMHWETEHQHMIPLTAPVAASRHSENPVLATLHVQP
jgi:hypothetical protein